MAIPAPARGRSPGAVPRHPARPGGRSAPRTVSTRTIVTAFPHVIPRVSHIRTFFYARRRGLPDPGGAVAHGAPPDDWSRHDVLLRDPRKGRSDQPPRPRIRLRVGPHPDPRPHRGRRRRRRRAPARPGPGGRGDHRGGPRPLPGPLPPGGHRPLRGAHGRGHPRRRRQGRVQQLARRRTGARPTDRAHERRHGRADHVRRALPHGPSRLAAGPLGRRRPALRQSRRRPADAAHGPRGGRPPQRPGRPRLLRARRPRHRGPRRHGAGHRRRQAAVRHHRRRAHDPALRLGLRRQRPAGQDRPRPAPGLLRRLGLGPVHGRAVHAHRHPRPGHRPHLPHLRRHATCVRPSRRPVARRTWP